MMFSLNSKMSCLLLLLGAFFFQPGRSFAAPTDYQPDAQISFNTTVTYTGDDAYYPVSQITSGSVANLVKAIYYINLQNDSYLGLVNNYSVSGSPGNDDWIVSYYSQQVGGTDITEGILDGSWLTGNLSPGGSKIIRLEVIPAAGVEGGIMFPVEIIMSDRQPSPVTDVVRAETICTYIERPDIQIKQSLPATYTGDNIYNSSGTSQTLSSNINNTRVATYYLKIENDGNVTSAFTITGTASFGGWIVSYYDALSDGDDITAIITGPGWQSDVLSSSESREIRVEISPGLVVTGGSVKNVYITMKSLGFEDVILASTTCIQGAVVQVSYGASHPASSYEINNNPKLSMMQFNVNVPSGNEGVWVQNISIQASGSGLDHQAVSGIRLVRDSNSNRFYDEGEIVLAGPVVYSVDNGTATLSLSPELLLPVGFNGNWLVVYEMAGTAELDQTFSVTLSAMQVKGEYSLITIIPQTMPLSGNTMIISNFMVSTPTGNAPLLITFSWQLEMLGSIVRYEIDFDYNGLVFRPKYQSIFSADTSFIYTAPGGYTARIQITYLDGNTIFRDAIISVIASAGTPEISSVYTSPLPPGNAPFTVNLTANANPVTGAICAYLWDFDGNDTIDYISSVSQASYTYTQAGDYYPGIYVQNTLGLTAKRISSRIRVLSVTPAPAVSIDQPADTITVTAGDNILFSGSGVPASGGVISRYEWDFDNDDSFDLADAGATGTYYTFLYPGVFNIRLRVTETSGAAPAGISAETVRTVIVKPSLVPRIVITQAGRYQPGKDALRENVDGYFVTIKAVPIGLNYIDRVYFRYRSVDYNIPNTFVSPDDDPWDLSITYPEITTTGWANRKLATSMFYMSDLRREYFLTTLNARWLSTDWWYEIIALVNFNPADYTFDAWNADQTQTRVFFKNVYTLSPETEEGTDLNMDSRLVRTVWKSRNTDVTKNDTTVFIPADGVSVVTDTLTIDTPASVITPVPEGFVALGLFRNIKTNYNLRTLVRVKIEYPDAEADGIVDGTAISETSLVLCRYDEDNSVWIPLLNQGVDRYSKNISGWTTHWGTFGVIGQLPPDEDDDDDFTSGSSAFGVEKGWGFCFIATAAYGTPMADEVRALSVFRDRRLLNHPAGRRLVRGYYAVSPPIAKFIAKRPALCYITRQILKPVVWVVNLIN